MEADGGDSMTDINIDMRIKNADAYKGAMR